MGKHEGQDEVLRALLELREQVVVLEQYLRRGTQLTYTFKQAAHVLGRESPKTISRMVKKGLITTVTICGSEMVPLSELERLATPASGPHRKGGAKPPVAPRSPKDEAQRARELLKRR